MKYTYAELMEMSGLRYHHLYKAHQRGVLESTIKRYTGLDIDKIEIVPNPKKNAKKSSKTLRCPWQELKPGDRGVLHYGADYKAIFRKYDEELQIYIVEVPACKHKYQIIELQDSTKYYFRKEVTK